jgi:cobalt-zinc-cadmium efflux system protein
MSHSHDAPDGRLDARLWAAAVLNVGITGAEVAGGLLSGSLALLSDAAHNASDVVAVVLALWARKVGRRPPTMRHSYGLKRTEVIVALANAASLVGVTALIGREAILRVQDPQPVAQGTMLAVASVALGANVASVLLLRRHERDDVNVRSAFLHMAQDALASFAVVLAALFAHTPAGVYLDPVAALVVSLAVLRSALSLARETLRTLLEGTPPDVNIADLAAAVDRAFAPARIHHVHVWETGPRQRLLTAHLALREEMDGRAIEALLGRVKTFLREGWSIDHATLEPEIAGCEEPGLLGRWSVDPGKEDKR